ncbi:hypothetical protein ACLMJK_007987 [Lecanora helva]
MLDENLPTFYLRSSNDGVKHNATVLLSHFGSDALPEYSLRHPDPSLPASKNRYAVALYDSHNPEILFGEVLLIPEWTHPNPTAEQLRLNGGVPPPPQPILPSHFVIQLYNPDQQVTVKLHPSTWKSDSYWEFEMPQQSFRKPSASSLDRTQSDPTASEITPKLGFKWKKDGRLSKDFVCSLSGKSTNPDGSKRKNREPDITIAIFRHFKELTIYEPNLSRVEMEDPKGLEVVLLLGAIVIREVYSSNIREAFNITDVPRRNSAEHAHSSPTFSDPTAPTPPPRRHRNTVSNTPPLPPLQTQSYSPNHTSSRPPPTDPRSQWELDAETFRLRQAQEAEDRARRKADAAETKRVKRMLEDEERRARDKQKEIDRETERLKKLYGREQEQSLQQLRNSSGRPVPQQPSRRTSFQPTLQPPLQGQAVTSYPPAPVTRPHSAAPAPYIASTLQGAYDVGSASGFVGSSGNLLGPGQGQQQVPKKKSSFFGLRGGGAGEGGRLTKQRSTVF